MWRGRREECVGVRRLIATVPLDLNMLTVILKTYVLD